MPSAPPIIDGVLARKDHRGTWAKRYFRTHKYNLNYYTSNLSAIEKSFDASGEHFKYRAIGSPTEVFRLELLLKVEKREGNVFYFEIEDPDDDEIEEFELRCCDEKAAARWAEAIEELAKRANEDKLRIGTLHIEVDGGFLIGKHAARSPTVRLELDFPARDAIDVVPEVAATSEDATSKVDADLLYENLDEADDAVARCPALRLDAHLPCHASSAKFVLALVEDAEAHAAATSPEVTGERSPTERLLGADLSCADQSALADAQHSFHSAIGKHVYGDSLEASRVAPEDDAEAEPAKLQGVVLAKRVGHLFELQEQRAIWVSQMVGSLPEASGFGRSAIDGGRENDQVGPDGSKPSKPGYKWYALLDDKGEKVAAGAGHGRELPNSKGSELGRVAAVLHAHVWFAEDPIAVVDGALERLECPDHESAGFDTAVLQSAIDRASTVLASMQLIGKALDDFTHWVEPKKTAAIYALMVYLAWRWPHAGMAYFPVGMLLPILYAAPPRVRRALGKPSEAESSADGRGVATCRVAVLEARGLAAADDNITTEASSDPYVAIVTAPGEPPPEVAEARTPTLVGVTESIYGTLAPVWDAGQVEEAADGGDRDKQETCFLAPSLSLQNMGLSSSGSPDACHISSHAIHHIGDRRLGKCARPSIDFRSAWDLDDGRTFARGLADPGDAAPDCEEPLGAIKIRVQLETDPGHLKPPDAAEMKLITSLLETTVNRYEDADAKESGAKGMMAQYDEMMLMMKRTQNSALNAVGKLERIFGLLTWEHPIKTGGFPGEVHKDHMIGNTIASLPSTVQKTKALAVKNKFAAAQDKRLSDDLRLHLRLGYGTIDFQKLIYSWNDKKKHWSKHYVVINGHNLYVWKSAKAALENHAPIIRLTCSKPALTVLTVPATPHTHYLADHLPPGAAAHPITAAVQKALEATETKRVKRAESRASMIASTADHPADLTNEQHFDAPASPTVQDKAKAVAGAHRRASLNKAEAKAADA
ncbi:hypothetical protein JL722_6961 [Aureococcus anophagefferens]|nr:hypothetical protein JL722_6961 [Aureococcus anophagefferens]